MAEELPADRIHIVPALPSYRSSYRSNGSRKKPKKNNTVHIEVNANSQAQQEIAISTFVTLSSDSRRITRTTDQVAGVLSGPGVLDDTFSAGVNDELPFVDCREDLEEVSSGIKRAKRYVTSVSSLLTSHSDRI